MNRTLVAARLHAVHALIALGIPWVVVGSSFAINLVVWAALPADARDEGGTGGIISSTSPSPSSSCRRSPSCSRWRWGSA
ncbi:hypothetical protein ACFQX8_20745 [Klenkia terrae]|uniref:hypothetical protein n=1 Tax=Klenkia terrae TaxID=1052259 RepID=UPI00361D6687